MTVTRHVFGALILLISAALKPDLLPMNGSNSNSFPLGARKNKGLILNNIDPLFSEPWVRAPREKITSNMTAFIGSKSGLNGNELKEIFIQSDLANYQNQGLTFRGHVVCGHPMVQIRTPYAIVPTKDEVVCPESFEATFREGGVLTAAKGNFRAVTKEFEAEDNVRFIAVKPHPMEIQAQHLKVQYTIDEKGDCSFQQAVLEQAKGHVTSKEVFSFAAQHVCVDNTDRTVRMAGNVKIDRDGNCELTAPEVFFNFIDKVWTKTDARGMTVLSISEKGVEHTIKASKGAVWDAAMRTIVFKSEAGRQVFVENDFGEIFANQAAILYDQIDGKIQVKKILLQGDVKILNRLIKVGEAPGGHMQFALADEATYIPADRTTTLRGTTHRVLFLDRIHQLQVSAPALTMKRKGESWEHSVEGEGHVRFKFNQQELAKVINHLESLTGPE